MEDNKLPEGFKHLEPFIEEWVLPDTASRLAKRQDSTIEDIMAFYGAMLPLGDKALEYLSKFELGELPPEGERLLKLMLALAEIAPAVEWYDDPRVTDGFSVTRIKYLRQIPDTSAQR